MDAITTAGEATKTITGDYIMTGIMLFIFLLSTGYLIKVIKAIIRDHKAQIVELNTLHQTQINSLIETNQTRISEMNNRYQRNIESMNQKLVELNNKSLDTQKDLIQTIKDNNEIILQNNGVSIRLETSITALLDAVKSAGKLN